MEKCPKNGYFDKKNQIIHKSKVDGLKKLYTRACLFYDLREIRAREGSCFRKTACILGLPVLHDSHEEILGERIIHAEPCKVGIRSEMRLAFVTVR